MGPGSRGREAWRSSDCPGCAASRGRTHGGRPDPEVSTDLQVGCGTGLLPPEYQFPGLARPSRLRSPSARAGP